MAEKAKKGKTRVEFHEGKRYREGRKHLKGKEDPGFINSTRVTDPKDGGGGVKEAGAIAEGRQGRKAIRVTLCTCLRTSQRLSLVGTGAFHGVLEKRYRNCSKMGRW